MGFGIEMLTVWCVLNGTKYKDSDAHILKGMVTRNLGQPHKFRCLSDRQIAGIDCLIPTENWPGWWAKTLLFRYSTGPCLYLDLDVVITGNLDRLLSDTLSMPANWAQSGHGGCQSSVMAWDGDYSSIADSFDVDQLAEPERGNCGAYGPGKLWGDQEFITAIMGEPGDYIVSMKHIYSYKYHCRESLPADASVVCFHGNPKPGEVNHEWVKVSRSMQTAA